MPILGIMASQISGHLWAPSGAYDALATVTVPSGGAASVSFVGIPSGYKHLQIRAIARNTSAANGNFYVGYNGTLFQSGNTSYVSHRLRGDGSSATASYTAATSYGLLGSTTTNATSVFAATIMDILDYSNTNKYKTIRSLEGYDANGSGNIILNSHLWMNTSAINQIDIQADGNFAEFSQLALYGVK